MPPFLTELKDVKTVGTKFMEDCNETNLLRPRGKAAHDATEGTLSADGPCLEAPRKKPLQLLDLPVDILREIVNQITHTNDLTALAQCHSALHALTIPHIYSRFDIVWPDLSPHSEPRSGVDALTYGLATLVMAEEVFGEAGWQASNHLDKNKMTETQMRRRRGNYYAQFTRKFSLGNGPADWVQEYWISKEGGKMLGTLVALALARMRNLETFIWDMPTGILRDVWSSLSYLGEGADGRPCRLERVWVRWHDSVLHSLTPVDPRALPNETTFVPRTPDREERPSFSILPPLKSLSVLDIDELQYLDEMSVLISRSQAKLRELRVGIARHAADYTWTTVFDGDEMAQVDLDNPTASTFTIGLSRLGGILGVLTGVVHDMRQTVTLPRSKRRSRHSSFPDLQPNQTTLAEPDALATASSSAAQVDVGEGDHEPSPPLADAIPDANQIKLETPLVAPQETSTVTPTMSSKGESSEVLTREDSVPNLVASPATVSAEPVAPVSQPSPKVLGGLPTSVRAEKQNNTHAPMPDGDGEVRPRKGMLELESLELERIPLSIPVLRYTIDWAKLTSLTLLNCQNHEQLWKILKRVYCPHGHEAKWNRPTSGGKFSGVPPLSATGRTTTQEPQYKLSLRKIHTNTVSPGLLAFVKETLAPNSLQTVFLQESARWYTSASSVDAIFRSIVKRHRSSLRRLLIDSTLDGPTATPLRSRRWMLTREMLGFITSGKMPALRELGMALSHADWHYFLQHLPSIPHLRSLYIPHLDRYVHAIIDPRDLALQIVDIVVLRPEIELCYMGIIDKCFEIQECNGNHAIRVDRQQGGPASVGFDGNNDEHEHNDLDEESDADDEGDEDEEDPHEHDSDSDRTLSDNEDTDSEDESGAADIDGPRMRLREILFYDDKVAIFKARHGKL